MMKTRTRMKFSLIVLITAISALAFFSGIALDQYNKTTDISAGVGFIIGGVLGVMTAIIQIYGNQETKRPSLDKPPIKNKRGEDTFEDESDSKIPL